VTSFRYAAKGPGGKTVEGTITAADKQEAVAELRKQDLVVMRVDEASAMRVRSSSSGGSKLSKARASCKKTELVLFTRQLATMINAGLALLESLEVLADQAESPGMKATCQRLINEVRGGSDLSDAMETCPRAFGRLYVSMVRAAEVSGQLDVILTRLAEYLEASEELKREIRSAMAYPTVSLVLVIAITMFLMIGIVPGFRQVFESLGSELPALTTFVLETSESMRDQWYFYAIGFIVAAVGLGVMKRTPTGSLALDHFVLRMPVFGPLFRKVALARFSRTFATLIRSGVPIMSTLEIVADTSGNQVVANVVRDSRDSVRSGNMLSEPLAESSVFPKMVVKMISIGERSGALETLLEKIAEFYDSQVKAAVKSLTSLIEPLMISVMGVLVGGVVLAVFLPLLDVVGKLSGQ
jgi:type IV pilus assembly protein PilC